MTTYHNAPVDQSTRAANSSNGLAIAGLVCGIIGIFLFQFILGPLAIIFGGVGLHRANHGATHRTMSIFAIVLGIIGVALFVAEVIYAANHGGSFSYRIGK